MRADVPEACQRIWHEDGLKVGGIPVFNASKEPVLAQQMIEKRLRNIEAEADFFTSIILDDQHAVADSWCRVQSVILLLRYSLATKLYRNKTGVFWSVHRPRNSAAIRAPF